MIFDPRIIAERKRLEPIFFFIYNFLEENNPKLKESCPLFWSSFENCDKDKDKLLNREEFQCFIRHWAKCGFIWNMENNPEEVQDVNLTQEFLDELFENFLTCYNYNGYGIGYEELEMILDEVLRWNFERHLR